MAGPEAQQKAPEQPKDIPGFKGLERMEKIDALKKGGAFREFLDKVISIRSNPEQQKKVAEALQKIDSDPNLSDDQKKEQLRLQPQADLLAIIGKNIEFGEKGMNVTLDFGKLAFAEQKGIGAGHLFPPNATNVSFGGENKGTEAKRSPGTRGGEYRSKKNKYMSSFTGTKLFIAYKDIMPFDAKQMESAIKLEKDSMQKVQATVGEAHSAQAGLRGSEKLTPPAVAAPLAAEQTPAQAGRVEPPLAQGRESNERLISHSPVFIGDSQVEGLAPTLRRKGVKAIDLRSMKMEDIARGLKDPNYLNSFYERTGNGQAFAESRKRTLLSGVEALKTADTVVLQCGGNNIANGHSLETMQRHFRTLIGTIKEINPNAKIRIGLMLIRNTNRPENDVATRYNEWLKGNAQKEGVELVDSRGIMMAYRERFPNRDWGKGAHLHGDEYKNLANGALEAINYQPA